MGCFLNKAKKNPLRPESRQEAASLPRVCLPEKWAKVHKLAEAVAETEQTACDTVCLRHL